MRLFSLPKKALVTLSLCGALLPAIARAQVVSTVAGQGQGNATGDGGYALDAKFTDIGGILADTAGNLYVTSNLCVRKIDAYGIIRTIAGFGNSGGKSGDGGPATAAKVFGPTGMALAKDGSLYFSDTKNSCVRRIDNSGVITTIAGYGAAGFEDDTLAIHAKLNAPGALAFDDTGNLYIADEGNYRIRKINTAGWITTIAGAASPKYKIANKPENVPATEMEMSNVDAIVTMRNGDIIFTDGYTCVIRKITPDGKINTIAGDWKYGFGGDNGPAKAAKLANPKGLCKDSKENLYISEYGTGRVRKITSDGIINTVAGGGKNKSGAALDVAIESATHITADARDNLYVSKATAKTIVYYSTTTPQADEQMIVFPSPCQGFTNVILPSGSPDVATVYVLDMSGRVVSQSQGPTNGYIALHFEDAGFYTLVGLTKNSRWTGKVTVVSP